MVQGCPEQEVRLDSSIPTLCSGRWGGARARASGVPQPTPLTWSPPLADSADTSPRPAAVLPAFRYSVPCSPVPSCSGSLGHPAPPSGPVFSRHVPYVAVHQGPCEVYGEPCPAPLTRAPGVVVLADVWGVCKPPASILYVHLLNLLS